MKHDEKDQPRGEMIVYQTDDGRIKLDVRLEQETLWMTQSDMAQRIPPRRSFQAKGGMRCATQAVCRVADR